MNERRRFLQVLGGSVLLLGCGSGGGSSGGNPAGGSGGLGGGAGVGGAGGAAGAGGGSAGTTGCDPGAFQQGYVSDKCHTHRGKFDLGVADDYAGEGLFKSKNAQSNVLVGRDAGGLYAMSSLCTHQCCDMNSNQAGSLTTANGAPAIRCNCHGSLFRADGSVQKGPAYTALQHFALTLECDGHIYVDTEQPVDAGSRLAV